MQNNPPARRNPVRSLILGGILPIVIYTIIEEYFGTLWGLVAGMVFGVFEILSEWIQQRKIETITWIGNGLLIGLGVISLVTSSGIWFKLQPAILELAMASLLIGSVFLKRPFLVLMSEKQGLFSRLPSTSAPLVKTQMAGITFRIGIFFVVHALLASWAALYWSTRAWAILKGVGFTLTLILYVGLEGLFMRRRISQSLRHPPLQPPL